mmetsp:Transcript_41129/g.130258  ORF Transcript_41129/g.130258 Transcript_41129/m.130258 type:complete len:454 (-) Transcript_41129:74-1435(-)
MWHGGVYPLAILIAAFSGIWPYAKLWLMLLCWFSPVWFLSLRRRQQLLDFLDAYGKWSLVDTFVLVLFMVAFRFELSGLGAPFPLVSNIFKELGQDASFVVYIQAARGFYVFLAATIVSLILGHAMTACHRYALRIGEFGTAEDYVGALALIGGRRRLCNILRPPEPLAGKIFAWGPVAAVAVSLVLVLLGIFLDTMEFRFLGLAGFLLGEEASTRPYSIISLDLALPAASNAPDDFGVRVIQVAFIFFAGIMLPIYLCILICLWVAPLKNRKQREFLVAAQVLNAWSGTDVFCVSIFASVLEIRQFASFIIGDKCDAINKVVAKSSLAPRLPGSTSCFDVESVLRPGLWLLASSSIIALVTGQILLSRCSTALFSVHDHGSVRRGVSAGSRVHSETVASAMARATTPGATRLVDDLCEGASSGGIGTNSGAAEPVGSTPGVREVAPGHPSSQ